MEIKVLDSKDNPLLSRKEVKFKIDHARETTPKIQDVKQKLAAMLTAKPELLLVDNIQPEFGRSTSMGYAKLYESEDSAKQFEGKHILKMNEKEVTDDEKSA